MSAVHTCHARSCSRPVPPRLFMCPQHWRMVPTALKRAVWRAYVPGQENRKDPTLAYSEAAFAAIKAVSEREGIPAPADGSEKEDANG